MRTVLCSIADASWFMVGTLGWALILCAFDVEVTCYATGNSARFPGWWR